TGRAPTTSSGCASATRTGHAPNTCHNKGANTHPGRILTGNVPTEKPSDAPNIITGKIFNVSNATGQNWHNADQNLHNAGQGAYFRRMLNFGMNIKIGLVVLKISQEHQANFNVLSLLNTS
ncbi:5016_t:CDS:2, partial [Ambispora leptoticha]